jgi:hypothetical protein
MTSPRESQNRRTDPDDGICNFVDRESQDRRPDLDLVPKRSETVDLSESWRIKCAHASIYSGAAAPHLGLTQRGP